MNLVSKFDSRLAIGQLLRQHREDSGKSRSEVAKAVHISPSTIERIEDGTTSIEFDAFINICRVCDANPLHDLFLILNHDLMGHLPQVMKSLNAIDGSADYKQAWNDSYNILLESAKTCNLRELTALCYLLSGEYGGDRYALLQKYLADAQCPVGGRDVSCGIILNNYEDAVAMDNLPDHRLEVDVQYVKDARRRGKQAHREGKREYI